MDYSNPLTWFLYILPPYLFQLALAEGMFCCRLKIRRFLLPRLLSSALVCAAALWLAARAITWQPGPDGVVITTVYLALFFLTVGVLKLCFQASFATLLFYGIAAYATQNLAYRIYSIFELTGAVWRLGDRIGPAPAYLLCWNGIFIVVASAVYLIFTRPMLRQDAAALRNLKVYALVRHYHDGDGGTVLLDQCLRRAERRADDDHLPVLLRLLHFHFVPSVLYAPNRGPAAGSGGAAAALGAGPEAV